MIEMDLNYYRKQGIKIPMAFANQTPFVFYDDLVEKIMNGNYSNITSNMNDNEYDNVA